MKKYIFIIILLISYSKAYSEDTIKIKPDITKVTVFLKGAEITRIGDISLPKGNVKVLFWGLEPDIDPNSIRINCNKEITILSVVNQSNFLKLNDKKAEISSLEKKKKDLQYKISVLQSLSAVYKEEQDLILTNKSLSSTQESINIEELKKAAAFYRERLTEINLKVIDNNQKIKEISDELLKITNQLNELNSATLNKTSEIILSVTTSNAVTSSITLSYILMNAGWVPKYDVRANDITLPLDLVYKADVHQNTEQDWKNVQLNLSTGQPFESGTKPTLDSWILRRLYTKDTRNEDGFVQTKVVDENGRDVSVSKSSTTQFKIEQSYSVPSDNKFYSVEIIKYNVPAIYEYSCVPKLLSEAFLMAKIVSWEQYNLISGEINLYFEGTYVGKSSLNTNITQNTLMISLGKDKNVVVSRNKIKDFSKKQFLSSKKSELYAWEINVRNNKKQPISLVIEDQFPISTNKEIEVDRLDNGGAAYDDITGKLTWKVLLNASESKKFVFKYDIKYPSKSTIAIE
jgi:hypothetical protein